MVSFFVIKCVQCFSDNIYSKPIIVVESKERSNRIIGEREHTLRIKHIFKNAISGSEQQNWTHSNIVEYHEISDEENDALNEPRATIDGQGKKTNNAISKINKSSKQPAHRLTSKTKKKIRQFSISLVC